MASSDDFSETLDALEARRREAEERVAGQLEQARGLLDELATEVEAAHRLLEQMRERWPDEEASHRREGGAASRGPADAQPERAVPEPEPWPRDGIRNRLAGWLFEDVLRSWDEEHAADRQRLEALAASAERLGRSTRTSLQRLAEGAGVMERAVADSARERTDSFTWVVASLLHAVEALATVVGVHEALITLADARGAETVRRATGSADARMEELFDELGRRQEALLADLVGRRRHLLELIERSDRGGPDVAAGEDTPD